MNTNQTKAGLLRKLVVLALLMLALLPCARGEVADDKYIHIYALIEEGDALSSSQPTQALVKYHEAQTALEKFHKAYPDWNSQVVNFRLNYLASKLGIEPIVVPTTTAPETPAATPASPVGGLFPKMPAAPKAYVVNCQQDSRDALKTAWALQGLINRRSAEVYIISNSLHREQLEDGGKPFELLTRLTGDDAGLRTLFQKCQWRVKKMFVYDVEKDWTWYLALMAAAQQDGIPVTESLKNALTSEFGWKGEVEDFRDRWANRIEAYDWALAKLMPACSKQVVFALRSDRQLPLVDYAVASKGFAFWLDFYDEYEKAEVKKIFQTKGYGVGTSLMGYGSGGDEANATANRYGIGYVVSDLYANGSFWSSFPNKTYTQALGRAVAAQPGKIYAHIMWSDGDNIQFDQNALYHFWHDPARGSVPVATELSPTLQELNPPLLDWYYSRMTDNDELVAGPTGVQFIYIRDFKDELFPAWCRLNRTWCAGAGFHSARIWLAPNPSVKYSTYMKSCGLAGMLGEGRALKSGFPPKIDTWGASNEEQLFEHLAAMEPNPQAPVFCGFTCIVAGFDKRDGGYSAIKRQVDRVEAAYPGRYVFLLPKDQFATIEAYYYSDARQIAGRPGGDDGLAPVSAGDGEFTVVERDGEHCWLVPKHTPPHYFYLKVTGTFRPQPGKALEIELEYFDAGSGEIVMDYDSTDIQATLGGAYKKHPYTIHRTNKAQWQQASFRVNDAGFGGSQNGHADFRFTNGGDDLLIRAVRVRRVGP